MTQYDAQGLAARFTEGVGLVDVSLQDVKDRLVDYRPGLGQTWSFARETTDAGEALAFLSTLSFPPSRHVAFATVRGHAAFVNNRRGGSDCGERNPLSRQLGCRHARVVSHPGRVWRRGSRRVTMKWEARIFSLSGPDCEPIRQVCCANDGGTWIFEEHGPRQAIESTFPYHATRKRDRFSDAHLRSLAESFALSIPTGEDLMRSGRYLLYEGHYPLYKRPILHCSLAEADDPAYGYYTRGMWYAESMKTHFSSVILDLGTCVEINPEYEPRVRERLAEARLLAAAAGVHQGRGRAGD